jgi:hypothetical protein
LLSYMWPQYSHDYLSSHNDAEKPLLPELSLAVTRSGFQRSLDRNGFQVMSLQKSTDEKVNILILLEANQKSSPSSTPLVDVIPEWKRNRTERAKICDVIADNID